MKTTPKPFAFVIMPFDDKYNDVYQVAIKDACEKAEAYCERLDEQIFDESMLDRIYNQIAKADILIADMTGRNPNVFYEVGYAHALGKRVILITQEAADIPFDLKHHFHIVYGGRIGELRNELSRRIKWYVDNPAGARADSLSGLQIYVEGQLLVTGLEITVKPQWHHKQLHASPLGGMKIPTVQYVLLQFAAYNPDMNSINTMAFNPLLVTDSRFQSSGMVHDDATIVYDVVKMPDELFGHRPLSSCTVEPGGWSSIKIELYPQDELSTSTKANCVLRILSDGPSRDIEFTLNIECPPRK